MNIQKDTKGFTLLEVLISMVVLSVGILTLYTMQIGAVRGNAKAQTMSEVANAARNQIEQVLVQDFDNVVTTATVGTAPINAINWNVTSWRTDGVDNDGDGRTDEFDERGVKSVQLNVLYTDGNRAMTSTFELLKTEIF